MFIVQKFIRSDATERFFQVLEQTTVAWASLVHKSTLPTNAAAAEFDLGTAVSAIHSVILGKEATGLSSSFGYLQLSRFFDMLEHVIKRDRETQSSHLGQLYEEKCRGMGRGNATIAIDIFLSAQNQAPGGPLAKRGAVLRARRVGDRWRHFVKQSDLLLLIFSDKAESCVHVLPSSSLGLS